MSFGMHARNIIAGQGRYIADKAPEKKEPTMNTKEKIETMWLKRAVDQGLSFKSKTYRKQEVEFFAGAMAAIEAMDESPRELGTMSKQVPVIWIINIMSGRPVVERK